MMPITLKQVIEKIVKMKKAALYRQFDSKALLAWPIELLQALRTSIFLATRLMKASIQVASPTGFTDNIPVIVTT